MRYNAFFGELPLNAFKPRPGGGMTLEGGGNPISAVTDAVSNVVEGVGNIGQGLIDTVKENPLEAAALIGAGFYFAPEIGAWMNPATGEALSGTATGVAAGTTPTTTAALTGSTGTGLTAGGTGLGLTMPEATTGLGLTAPAASGLAAGTAAGTSAAELAGIGAGLGATGAAAGTGSLLGSAALPAAATLGAAAGGAGAGSTLSSMLPYMTAAQVGTGLLQSNAATRAADIQASAADRALAQQQKNFETINAQQAPQRGLGYTGGVTPLGALGSGTYNIYDANGNVTGTGQGSGYFTHQFDATDLAKGLAPNYDFMLQQGQMANQRAANVAGGGFGGNAMQGLNKFTQDYAGNAYQNAFNNYQSQRRDIYNTLAGIAGIGQTGQNAANTAGTNLANAASQLGVGSAGAQAAGQVGQTNALANTANNIIGNYTLASLLNQRGNVMG